MKTLKLSQRFSYTLQEVLQAREERFNNLDKFPELKKQELLETREEGQMKIEKRRLSLEDTLPSIVKKVLPSGSLDLIEDSKYNKETNIHEFTVYLEKLKDKLQVKGKTHYTEEKSGEKSICVRHYHLEIKVNAPLIGGSIESAIAGNWEKSLNKDKDKLEDFIKHTLKK